MSSAPRTSLSRGRGREPKGWMERGRTDRRTEEGGVKDLVIQTSRSVQRATLPSQRHGFALTTNRELLRAGESDLPAAATSL